MTKKIVSNCNIRYYDACALEEEFIFREIYENNSNTNFISHLALGEAYGNCLKKSPEVIKSFVQLIEQMKKHITVIGNDNIEKNLEVVKNNVKRISITDAMHLATALKYGCSTIRTSDSDLIGLAKDRCQAICKDCGIETFSISEIKFKPKSKYSKKTNNK